MTTHTARRPILAALLLLVGACLPVAAEDGGFQLLDEGAAAGGDEGEPAAFATVRRHSNRETLEVARRWAGKQGLKIRTFGDGPFRIMAVGGVPPQPKQLVEDGELVLQGLEIWTGRKDLFTPAAGRDEEVLWYLVIKGDGRFDAFLDHGRKAGVLPEPENEDVARHTNNTWAPRVAVTEIDKLTRGGIHRNITVYLATGLALRTFIRERSPEEDSDLPKWLVAGMQSELEKRICGSNRCYTISYEKSSVDLGQQDWARSLAKLIKQRSPHLMPAGDVMQLDLIGTSPEQYLQLWSLAAFVREVAGAGRGEKPGFAELLDRIARGEPADDAIYEQFDADNRELTRKWLRWAATQR